jgi:hypothetical protein
MLRLASHLKAAITFFEVMRNFLDLISCELGTFEVQTTF